MQGWIGNVRAIVIASVVLVSIEVDAQTPGSFNPLDVGSTSTASDAKLSFHSSGSGSTIDSQIVSTSGTPGTPNQATLILNSKIANVQGNIAAYSYYAVNSSYDKAD